MRAIAGAVFGAVVLLPSCSAKDGYVVTAGRPGRPVATYDVERCGSGHGVESVTENKSLPPVNITARIKGSRDDAEEVADCYRSLSYRPVKVAKQ
jgi:hypothetical protein